jgi:hypothetical protein
MLSDLSSRSILSESKALGVPDGGKHEERRLHEMRKVTRKTYRKKIAVAHPPIQEFANGFEQWTSKKR